MSEFLKMDIFFAVATAAVVILGAFAAVALYYVIRILRNVEHLTTLVSLEGERIREDIAELRASVRREGFKWLRITRFFSRWGDKKRKSASE